MTRGRANGNEIHIGDYTLGECIAQCKVNRYGNIVLYSRIVQISRKKVL